MMSPFGDVLNTRQMYSRFYQEVFTEVEVQFGEERPAWIPLDTLLAITELISEGINVNVTLIFSLNMYGKVIDSYLDGLSRLISAGKSPSDVSSVASFFVSRVDSAVDANPIIPESLHGKTAIANATMAYALFLDKFGSVEFNKMFKNGAQIIDIGAESARPGSDPLSYKEEIKRLHPILKKLPKNKFVISIDSYKIETQEFALNNGAHVINDIFGGSQDLFDLTKKFKTEAEPDDSTQAALKNLSFFVLQAHVLLTAIWEVDLERKQFSLSRKFNGKNKVKT